MTAKANELFISRLYDAPVQAVWDAWTDPEQVAQWWGPRGFTLTTHSKDLRENGQWRYTMHGPDGVDYPNITTYWEVEDGRKLVYDHGATEDTPPLFRVTVTFTDVAGKTQMDMTCAFETADVATSMKQFIKDAGGNGTWDRLAEYLEKQATQKEIFVINRTFNAPIQTMYEVWTQPEHLIGWSGPKGSQIEYIRADIREGGESFYRMTSSTGMPTLYGKAFYHTLRRPDLIIYTQQFADEHENISRHPLAPTWPESKLTHVQLTAESPTETRVTLTWSVYGEATPEEIAAFVDARAGMTGGWTGSFDRLDDYLVELKQPASVG